MISQAVKHDYNHEYLHITWPPFIRNDNKLRDSALTKSYRKSRTHPKAVQILVYSYFSLMAMARLN
jgi:hypothetical protein